MGRVGLISLGLFEDDFNQRFFDPADDQFMKLSGPFPVHLGHILFDALVEPLFEEGSYVAAYFLHEDAEGLNLGRSFFQKKPEELFFLAMKLEYCES